ncbi:hypothetical protein ACUM6F_04435 [Desulforudis sp. DRI-14]
MMSVIDGFSANLCPVARGIRAPRKGGPVGMAVSVKVVGDILPNKFSRPG